MIKILIFIVFFYFLRKYLVLYFKVKQIEKVQKRPDVKSHHKTFDADYTVLKD